MLKTMHAGTADIESWPHDPGCLACSRVSPIDAGSPS
jgi:hypothetical protein